MKRKVALWLASVLCSTAVVFGGAVTLKNAKAATAEVPESTVLTAETLNAGTTTENPWKQQFDYWSNASSVTYTAQGVEIVGTKRDNAFNIINGPMSIADGAAFEIVLNLPTYENGARVDSSTVYKPQVVLYSAGNAIGASMAIWGDSYAADKEYVTSEFTVGGVKAAGIKLPKSVVEKGGEGVKLGFTVEDGWYAEVYDETTGMATYAPVLDSAELDTALKALTAKEITRVQMSHKWDSASKTHVFIQELNGQNLCLDSNNKLTVKNGFNASSVKVDSEAVFLAGGTYNYELLGVGTTTSGANHSTVNASKTNESAELWQLVHTSLMGDIGWNSDASKGEYTASGVYLTLKKAGELVGNWSYTGSWGKSNQKQIEFTIPEEDGTYVLEVKILTVKGNVTVHTVEIETEKETYELTASATLLLEDTVSVNYYLSIVGSFGGSAAISEGELLLWNTLPEVGQAADTTIPLTATDSENGDYVANTEGVAAKKIGDTTYAQFRVIIKGEEVKSDVFAYSPKTYAMNKLGDGSADIKIKDLCLTLLDYAAAAQTYFNYNVENLANAEVTDQMREELASYREGTHEKEEYVQQSVSFDYGLQMTLELDGKIDMNCYVTAEGATKVEIVTFDMQPTTSEIEAKTGAVTLEKGADGQYKYTFEKSFAAKELGDEVWFVVYVTTAAGEKRSSAICYGPSVYANNKLASSASSEKVKALSAALLDYACAARIYFGYKTESVVASSIRENADGTETFLVGGTPFLYLGAESRFEAYTNCDGATYADYEKYVKAAAELGCNVLAVSVDWADIETEKGVYDFECINKILTYGAKYGVKIDLLWYSALMCGDSHEWHLPAYVFEETPRYQMYIDGSEAPYITNSTNYGIQTFLRIDDETFMARETAVVEALMEYIYEWEATRGFPLVLVGVQVYNEVDAFPEKRVEQYSVSLNGAQITKDQAWTTVRTAMNNCAKAFKSSLYNVLVRTNFMRPDCAALGDSAGYSPISRAVEIAALEYIDAVGYDPYLNDLALLKETIEYYQETLPTNFTHIAENGRNNSEKVSGEGTYLNGEGEALLSVSMNAGYILYELCSPVKFDTEKYGQGVLDPVTLADYSYTDNIRKMFVALQKVGAVAASVNPSEFAAFNIDSSAGKTNWSKTVNTSSVSFEFATSTGAKGFAIVYEGYIYAYSQGAATLTLSNGTFSGVETGYLDGTEWVKTGDGALSSNKLSFDGESVYRIKIDSVDGALTSNTNSYKG